MTIAAPSTATLPSPAEPVKLVFDRRLDRWQRSSPAKPPAKWKMALITWIGLFPIVVALGYLFRPFGLPRLIEQAVSTMIPVVMLTWVVIPVLARLFYAWLYPEGAQVEYVRTV